MNTVETVEAAQTAPCFAATASREWVAPEAADFDTAMEVTAYAGRR